MKIFLVTSFIASFLTGSVVSQGLSRTDRAVCDKYPDPHIRTWDNIYYDFHGDADLIACAGEVFDVHWRSETRGGWSAITKVAVHIHATNDTLEILLNYTESGGDGDCCGTIVESECCDQECCGGKPRDETTDLAFLDGAAADGCCTQQCCAQFNNDPTRKLLRATEDHNYRRELFASSDPYYTINGNTPATPPANIGGYPFSITGSPPEFKLFMEASSPITVSSYFGSFRLLMEMHGSVAYTCVGTCGNWKDGGLTTRDGGDLPLDNDDGAGRRLLVVGDENQDVGTEWHVQDDDPNHMAEPKGSGPEYETRELNGDLEDDARMACAGINQTEARQACEFDIMLTGEPEWADAPRYKEPEVEAPEKNAECKNAGFFCRFFLRGECVYRCNREEYRCFPRLCQEEDTMRGALLFNWFNRNDEFVEGCSCGRKRRWF